MEFLVAIMNKNIEHIISQFCRKRTTIPIGGILAGLLLCTIASAQVLEEKVEKFFQTEEIIDLYISTDLHLLSHERKKEKYQPAFCIFKWSDGTTASDSLAIKPRGFNRMEQCIFPPFTVNFKKSKDSVRRSLETLKIVIPCSRGSVSEQLILREFLVYKMYNLLTEKSFRTRLLRIEISDPDGRIKPFTGYAFFLEDENRMAGRNRCYSQKRAYKQEMLDRQQMTLMYLFQYMIGNTDFTVDVNKNIKVIRSFEDGSLRPYTVPYDFDYSGMVNAGYAMPHPDYQDKINSVTDRLFLGPAIEKTEWEKWVAFFEAKEKDLYSLINSFSLLDEHSRREMNQFLKEFYQDIHSPQKIREVFLTGSIYQ
jgi:hypothetical protein